MCLSVIIVKVKVKLSLCFNWAPPHKGLLGSGGIAPLTLTPALDGSEWSASRPGRFTPKERAPGTHWIRGLVGPRAILDAVVKGKIPSLRRESNPRTPIVQPVAQRYTDWAVTALIQRHYDCDVKGNRTSAVHSRTSGFIGGDIKALSSALQPQESHWSLSTINYTVRSQESILNGPWSLRTCRWTLLR
jgi:hypothetical protein